MHTLLEDLNWRYATKKYDTTKKIPQDQIDILIEALRLSPSSYGLLPFKILMIESTEIREKLKPHSWNQSQITDASHLLVFCSLKEMTDVYIDQHTELVEMTRSLEKGQLQGFANFIKGKVNEKSTVDQSEWNARQSYIALGILMQSCANLRIDATPMEGFEHEKYNEILGLNDKNLDATLVCALGYRSEEDTNQHLKKVRKPMSEFLEIV
jgi:nitroreductase/dihydropteridine reductase